MTPNLARRDGKPFRSYPVSPAIYDEDGARSQHHFQEPFFTERRKPRLNWLLIALLACLGTFWGWAIVWVYPFVHRLLARLL